MGMVFAARRSEALGSAPQGTADRLESLLRRAGLPTDLPPFARSACRGAAAAGAMREGSMEVQEEAGEIARLEALLGADPGAPAFAALAEANRRAGRLEEAERVAREGLRRRPEHVAGRVALALSLLDQGRSDEARSVLERVLEDVPDHPLAVEAFAGRGAAGRDPLDALADDEIEGAFADAETSVDEMVDAHDVAERALHAADLDAPEGVLAPDTESPFATRTVADLLERQGHRDEAAALRVEIARRSDGDGAPARGTLGAAEREHMIATLERWLENLRRTRR
jgi:tetratricopeptide (TPR) repeat protein